MSSDRISELPEDVVSHILSLMPTRYAVRTSVLSKRWRYSWMYVANLNFEDVFASYGARGENALTKFVDGVLKHCKSSQINQFRLDIKWSWVPALSVSSWINEAIRLKVNELDIKVFTLGLPLSMLTCKTLTNLTLKYTFFDSDVQEFLCQVNLPCLKTLDIAVYSHSLAGAFKLIRGCPMLENLSLEERGYREGEVDYIFNIPTLKRLKLIWASPSDCINKVVLNVPNLEHLFIRGYMYSIFLMEDVSSLVEAFISFSQIKSYRIWVQILKGLVGVKSLSVQVLSSDIDLKNLLTLPQPVFPNLNHLELKEFWDSSQIPQFLYSCPELQHVCIEKLLPPFYMEHEGYIWVEPRFVPACIRTKLTTIKFQAWRWWKCDLPFLKYMLANAEVLKTVTVSLEKAPIKERAQLREGLLKFPRASRFCEIHFHDN